MEESKETSEIFSVNAEVSENSAKFNLVISQIEDWVADDEIVGADLMVIQDREIIVHETDEGKLNQSDSVSLFFDKVKK